MLKAFALLLTLLATLGVPNIIDAQACYSDYAGESHLYNPRHPRNYDEYVRQGYNPLNWQYYKNDPKHYKLEDLGR